MAMLGLLALLAKTGNCTTYQENGIVGVIAIFQQLYSQLGS
jgi:hypothetical protein